MGDGGGCRHPFFVSVLLLFISHAGFAALSVCVSSIWQKVSPSLLVV